MQKTPPLFALLITGLVLTQVAQGQDGILAVSEGAGGGPEVSVYDATTLQLDYSFFAYSPSFTGGVNVAVGDVYGNGAEEVITGAGAGGGPSVGIFNGSSGTSIGSFFAFSTGYTGGINVAAGNVDGTGAADIVVGAASAAGTVSVFNGTTDALLATFTPFGPTFTGGVNVATGNLTPGGPADIIVSEATGGSLVEAFSLNNTTTPLLTLNLTTLGSGLNVAAGKFQGVGNLDNIAVASAGGNTSTVGIYNTNGTLVDSLLAFSGGFTGGVRLGAVDGGNSADDLLVGAGVGGGPEVETFDTSNNTAESSFFAFSPSSTGGIFVAGQGVSPAISVPEPAAYGVAFGVFALGLGGVSLRRKRAGIGNAATSTSA